MSRSSISGSSSVSFIVYLLLFLYLFVPGCSENACTRHWGENHMFKLPCGQKLINATWEDSDLVYTTRAMRPGEVAETMKLSVKVNWFLFVDAGVMTITECGSAPDIVTLNQQ